MAKQDWPRHLCDKIPEPNSWNNVAIIKAPHQNHTDGVLYGKISWKIFKFRSPTMVFWIPTNDGEDLNPPICPFCDILLED